LIALKRLSDKELIVEAMSVVKPRKIRHGQTVGTVGCALVTDKGNVYRGVCIDTASGMGFCAEHSAIAAMVTDGEHVIRSIVAIDKNGKILPPCGRCREFMSQIDKKNLDARVMIARNKGVKLRELLPHQWDEKKVN
jgi:cytidine deaminase